MSIMGAVHFYVFDSVFFSIQFREWEENSDKYNIFSI